MEALPARPPLPEGFEVALVLSGGATLGAYHVGACAALRDRDVRLARIAGVSIGAVTAAILLGNPPDRALDRLRAFWAEIAQPDAPWTRMLPDALRARWGNNLGLASLLQGRPGVFAPRYPGPWSILPGSPPDLGLRDHRPLAATLARFVDFDRLNDPATTPLSIAAVDLGSGEEVWFENRNGGLRAEHLLAATALAPLFAPVEVGGRMLCDAGVANNLPVDRIVRASTERPTLCLAVDLYAPRGERPQTLDQVATRMQDLAFHLQSRRSLSFLGRERALRRQADPALPPMILGHVAYRAPGHERTFKAVDFSAVVLEDRMAQGRRDMDRLLDRLASAPRNEALALVALASDTAAETPPARAAAS